MKKQSKSNKNKELWKKISKDMRENSNGCEVCHKKTSLQVHHITSKFYHKSLLRFEPSNLIVLCGKHHFIFHKSPVQTMRWLEVNRRYDFNHILSLLGDL